MPAFTVTTTAQQVAAAGVDCTYVNSGSANALLSWGDEGDKSGDIIYAGQTRNLRAAAAVQARTPSGTTTLTVTAVSLTVSEPLSFTDPRIGGVGDGVTDNTAAWNRAMSLLTPSGGALDFLPGVYRIDGTTDFVPGGVLLRGTGIDYSDPTLAAPARASVIRAGATMSRLVELGRNPDTSVAGDTGASMEDLVVDGRDLADTVVKTAGRRNYIRDCQVYWGNLRAVQFAGQNSYLIGGVQAQNDKGDVVLIDGYFDHKVKDGQQRQPGTTGVCIRVTNSVGDVLIRGNHMWAGANGVTAAAEALIAVEAGCSVVGIVDNIIEGVLGPEIKLNTGNTTTQNINICGNQIFNNGNSPDITHPAIAAVGGGASGFLADVNICGNIIKGQGATKRFKSLIEYSGTFGGTSRWTVEGNSCFCVQFGVTGSGSAPTLPVWGTNSFYDGSASRHSSTGSVATFSGDGSTTTFTITTNLIGAATSYAVTPATSAAGAAGISHVSTSGNNLVVTASTAPASGSSNVRYAWRAACSG